MTMTIPKLKTHSCSYSLRILLSLLAPRSSLAPRRDEIVPSAQVNQGMGFNWPQFAHFKSEGVA